MRKYSHMTAPTEPATKLNITDVVTGPIPPRVMNSTWPNSLHMRIADVVAKAGPPPWSMRLIADERNLVELGVRLDDLVSDARERSRERAGVEEDLPGRLHCAHRAARVAGLGTCVVIRLLSGLTGPG